MARMRVDASPGVQARDKKALACLRSLAELLEPLETKETEISQIQAPHWQRFEGKGRAVIIAAGIAKLWPMHLAPEHIPLHKQLEGGLTHRLGSSTPSPDLRQGIGETNRATVLNDHRFELPQERQIDS